MTIGQQYSGNPGNQTTPGKRTYTKRRTLSTGTRMFIIATWGAILAGIVFFGLTKIGF